jgi:hypothetical protein
VACSVCSRSPDFRGVNARGLARLGDVRRENPPDCAGSGRVALGTVPQQQAVYTNTRGRIHIRLHCSSTAETSVRGYFIIVPCMLVSFGVHIEKTPWS